MKKTKPIGIHLLGGAALLIGALTASADVVYTNYNLTHLRTEIYNDRIGNSRFFNDPNTDSIRVSTFLRPSPDSNVIGLPCLGNSADTCYSTNGLQTAVSVTHSSFGSFSQPMTFVGVTSAGGGGQN